MNMIKNLFLCLITVITLVGIIASLLVLYPRRYNDKLYMDDLSGTRSVLNDIKIKGVLSDGIQRTDFVYQDGAFDKKYELVTNNSIESYFFNKKHLPILPNLMVDKTYKIPDNADKQISSWTDEYGRKVTETKSNQVIIAMEVSTLIINTDIILHADDYRLRSYSSDNGQEMAASSNGFGLDDGINTSELFPVETVDDRIYLYTTTGADCSGFGGVYEIKIINKHLTVTEKNLAPLDLKDGDVKIVGMKASKSWFVFITVENEQVALYPFNRQTNSFENAIVLGRLPGNVKTEWDGYRLPIIREAFYDAAIQENQFLNIEVIDKPNDEYTYPKSCFYTADLVKNKKLLSYSENTAFDNGQSADRVFDRAFSETIMNYRNDRLYVLRSYWQLLLPIGSGMHNERVNGLHVSVYEDKRDVYQGEIISAAQEEYRYQGTEMYKSYGTTYIRGYYYLGID